MKVTVSPTMLAAGLGMVVLVRKRRLPSRRPPH
jgi:hypothetical protein